MSKWIKNATIKTAKTSRFPRFRHGALVADGGRVLAKGVNTPKPRTPDGSFSTHAEIIPLRRILSALVRQGRTTKVQIYVARVNNCNAPALSKPCEKCMATLKESNIISIIHYTTDTGWESLSL
jgi:tRNA(Arg) A34 adenosine deaminase TadA